MENIRYIVENNIFLNNLNYYYLVRPSSASAAAPPVSSAGPATPVVWGVSPEPRVSLHHEGGRGRSPAPAPEAAPEVGRVSSSAAKVGRKVLMGRTAEAPATKTTTPG